MIRAEDLVGKSYGEANALTGLEFNLRDHNTDHHLIQDLAQAETYLGIAEALQPENNSPTLTQKFSRLRNLSDYVSSRFNNFKHTKTAAALTAAGMISAATFGALTKDLGVELPDIVMDASAQSPDDTNDGTYKITPLTTNINGKANYPHISGDKAAWIYEEQGSIQTSNKAQILNLTTNQLITEFSVSVDGDTIDIYNDNLVLATGFTDKDIWLTNTSTSNWESKKIADDDLLAGNPSTDGEYIVWSSGDDESDYISIRSIDGSFSSDIDIGAGEELNPKVNNDMLVWVHKDFPSYKNSINIQDLNNYSSYYKEISSDCDEGTNPQIYGNKVIYKCDSTHSIRVYDIYQGKTVDNLDLDSNKHSFYENNIVWTNSLKDSINILNIETEAEIRIPGTCENLDIWENKVVWSDGKDIYLAEFSFDDKSIENPELIKLAEKYAPTYLFSTEEKYFPTDPYADDYDVTNNADKWLFEEFPKDQVVYYAITDYSSEKSTEHPEGFKVLQYWNYYVYNNWGSDDHMYDWEVIHKWIDNKNNEVYKTSASMHLWDNIYDENINRFFVEEGGHGLSKDVFMIDGIKIQFNGVDKILDVNTYDLRPLDKLDMYDEKDFPGELGKFPTKQKRYLDPNNIIGKFELPKLTEIDIKNSPDLRAKNSKGDVTGITIIPGVAYRQLVEDIPNSIYIFQDERIIILDDTNITVEIYGTEKEQFTLEMKILEDNSERFGVINGTINKGDTKIYDFSDLTQSYTNTNTTNDTKPNSTNDIKPKNNLLNTQWQTPVIAAIGGGIAAAIGLTAYRKKQQSKLTKSQQITPTKNIIIPQIKPNENISLANSDDSESDKSKLKSNSIKDLEDK